MTDQEREEKEKRLQSLLHTFRIPSWRVDQKDWGHIGRNLWIFPQNRTHPDSPQVIKLLRDLLGPEPLIVGEKDLSLF